MDQENYSYYDHLKAHDIIDTLKPLLDNGTYATRIEDGKLKVKQISVATGTPWVHIKHTPGFDCGLWHQVIFNFISLKLPEHQRFVPRNCQSCWKVVIKPKTLQQLFNLLELQKKLDRPSKCGIEPRESVHGLYGGYFYNKSLEAGLECYELVKKACEENEFLKDIVNEIGDDGRTTRLLLKRACTEFEHAVGPSDQWVITPEQNAVEDLVERYVVKEDYILGQPEHIVWNVKRRWIEWAWQYGDETYSRYTGGKPLYPGYVTYHQMEVIKNDNASDVS